MQTGDLCAGNLGSGLVSGWGLYMQSHRQAWVKEACVGAVEPGQVFSIGWRQQWSQPGCASLPHIGSGIPQMGQEPPYLHPGVPDQHKYELLLSHRLRCGWACLLNRWAPLTFVGTLRCNFSDTTYRRESKALTQVRYLVTS